MLEADDDGDEFFPRLIVGKDLERHFQLQDALVEFAKLFQAEEENGRAIAIIGAAFLDLQLEHILLTFLVDDEKETSILLKPDQPLGTFGNRIRATYCLGLINALVRDDLRLVARIRNQFAHNLYASFEDDQIKSWCGSLKWHREAYMIPPPGVSSRDLFHVGVHQLAAHLGGIVSIARSEKRQVRTHS